MLKAVFHTVSANIGIKIIYVVTGLITSRILGAAGRGELAAAQIWPVFLATCFCLGIPSAVVYNIKRYPTSAAHTLSSGIMVSVLTGLLATTFGWLLLPHSLSHFSPNFIRFCQLCVLLTPISALTLTMTSAVHATGNFFKFNICRLVFPIAQLGGLLLLVATHRLTPRTAVLAYLFPETLSLILASWHSRQLWVEREGNWIESFRRLLGFGLRAHGADLLWALNCNMDRVLLATAVTAAALGHYVVAISVASLLTVIPDGVSAVLISQAAGKSSSDVRSLVGHWALTGLVLSAAASLLGIAFGPLGVKILYGPQFSGISIVLRVLMMQMVFQGLTMTLGQGFLALNRPGIRSLLQLVGLTVTIPLVLVAAHRWSIIGASFAILISTSIRLVLTFYAYPVLLKMPCPRFWVSRDQISVMGKRVHPRFYLRRHSKISIAIDEHKVLSRAEIAT